jgi:hypothetical protein
METVMERTAFRGEWPSGHSSKREISSNILAALADPDLQYVCLFALIGLLITLWLAITFPLANDAISAIALLS